MAEDHNAVRVFRASLDSAWRDSGAQPAEEISSRLQRDRNYSLAASTIRGWLEHSGLPRKDDDFTEMCLLLVGDDRTRELVALLRRARRAIRSPAGPPPPDPPPPPDDDRGPQSSFRPWHAAALVALVVLGVVAALVLPPDDEDAGSSPVESSGTAVSGTSPDDPPCPTPTVQATSRNTKRAHATFCADRAEFLLYDDNPDGKSAVPKTRSRRSTPTSPPKSNTASCTASRTGGTKPSPTPVRSTSGHAGVNPEQGGTRQAVDAWARDESNLGSGPSVGSVKSARLGTRGLGVSTVLVAEGETWGALLILRYPDRATSSRMLADPERQEVTYQRAGRSPW